VTSVVTSAAARDDLDGPAAAVPDPFDPRRALGAPGLLGAFADAGVFVSADVHVALRLGRLGEEPDEAVALALALAVRGVRLGSVCVELATLHRTVVGEAEDPAQVAALPWPEPGSWQRACAASALVTDGTQGDGRAARLVGGLLYLERYWQLEERVRAELQRRDTVEPVADLTRLRAALDRLFPPAAPPPGQAASGPGTCDPGVDHQRLAAAVGALRRLSVVAGGPGTGKTTTVARLLAVAAAAGVADRPPRVALAAPTGKAAARLEEAVHEQLRTLDPADRQRLGELRASTVHRLLGARPGAGRFRHDRTNHLPFDLLVVDETSMVSLTLMASLLDALRPDARLVLVGDPDQLASVEAGTVLGDLTRAGGHPDTGLAAALGELAVAGGEALVNGVVWLRHTYRFTGAVGELARAVQAGDDDAALRVLRSGRDGVRFVEHDAGTAPDVVDGLVAAARRLVEAARDGDPAAALAALDAHRVLCGHRHGPFGASSWGTRIEHRVAGAGADPWYAGRPVLVTANDHDAGLYNGDVGVVVHTADGPRVAFARGAQPMLVAPARLGHAQTVHAMTVHRAQGSQFAAVTVVVPPPDSPLLTRELLYTALTRARDSVQVIGSEAAVRAAVRRPVSRASGLRHRLGAPGPPRDAAS